MLQPGCGDPQARAVLALVGLMSTAYAGHHEVSKKAVGKATKEAGDKTAAQAAHLTGMHECCLEAAAAGKGCCGKDADALKADYEKKVKEDIKLVEAETKRLSELDPRIMETLKTLAFARAVYALRLDGGRCIEPGIPSGCAFYDPDSLYHKPAVSTITYSG